MKAGDNPCSCDLHMQRVYVTLRRLGSPQAVKPPFERLEIGVCPSAVLDGSQAAVPISARPSFLYEKEKFTIRRRAILDPLIRPAHACHNMFFVIDLDNFNELPYPSDYLIEFFGCSSSA